MNTRRSVTSSTSFQSRSAVFFKKAETALDSDRMGALIDILATYYSKSGMVSGL